MHQRVGLERMDEADPSSDPSPAPSASTLAFAEVYDVEFGADDVDRGPALSMQRPNPSQSELLVDTSAAAS